MKNIVFLCALLIASVGSAQVEKELGSFDKLRVTDRILVTLVKADKNWAEVSGDKKEEVVFVNKNDQLKIRMKTESKLKGDEVEVVLYHKEPLDEIITDGGAQLTSDKPIEQSSLALKANKGSYIELELTVEDLEVKANSGGEIAVKGTANTQKITANTGGEFDGKEFKTKETDVEVKAGGKAFVLADEYVNARTRAGGRIEVYGDAEVDTEKFVGGKIKVHR